MTQNIYINQIFIPEVLSWILRGDNFVLEEDGDSGNGISNKSRAYQWKERHGLKSYRNCALSLDFAPIENGWFPIKNEVRKVFYWDEETTKEMALQGWAGIKQATIDRWVCLMSARFKEVIKNNGELTAF